jgi:hypothetical protein
VRGEGRGEKRLAVSTRRWGKKAPFGSGMCANRGAREYEDGSRVIDGDCGRGDSRYWSVEMGEDATLVKFGTQEHILDLRQTGLLYMNNLPYFWEIEDAELRGDQYDGVDKILRGPVGAIKSATGEEHAITNWTIKLFDASTTTKMNVFCMYALRPRAGTFPLDARNVQFGDCALVMTSPMEFMRRVTSSLDSQSIAAKARLVEYVDNDYTGDVGPFKKLRSFAYQSEWRLVCYDGPGGPREVRIGSLEDISVMMPSAEINRRLRLGQGGLEVVD